LVKRVKDLNTIIIMELVKKDYFISIRIIIRLGLFYLKLIFATDDNVFVIIYLTYMAKIGNVDTGSVDLDSITVLYFVVF
jgi:hypothetical protein